MLDNMPRLAALLLAAAALEAAPNFVILLADDLGYGDVGVYNPRSKIPTPNLDRLAGQGIRFTDAHTPSGVCSPTRYALLTGRYAWRTRLKSGVLNGGSAPLIAADRLTLAGMLRERGYETGVVGKWHLGFDWPLRDESKPQMVENVDWSRPLEDGPLQHGFSYQFGLGKPAWTFVENGRVLARPSVRFDLTHLPAYLMGGNNNKGVKAAGFEFERMLPRFTEEAVGFIQRSAGAKRPFFLFFTPIAPHRPVVPNNDFVGTSAAGLYGDFVAEFDWAAGEIMAALDRSGTAGETLVLVTSDNGPEVDAYRRALEYDHYSMGALRGVKRDLWEGGHRVPFIARWPGKIPADSVQSEVICLTDLPATIAALIDYPLPADAAEDSYDVRRALFGETIAKPLREATVHHGSQGWFGIRQGGWVLIDHPSGDNNRGRNAEPEWFRRERMAKTHDRQVELFNLQEDPAQRVNLAAAHPEKVEALQALLERYRREGRSARR